MISSIFGAVGITIVIGMGIWVFGDTIARWAGLLLLIAGAGYMVGGLARGAVMAAVGLMLWLAGHWVFAYKHHVWRSALAQRLFAIRRLDPTRGWVVPVADVQQDEFAYRGI
ncbi:hypothetical protein [Nocardia abscessus]|uniref:hypothetical protein n=1 Tax=Nocardia abscessus TaxID=120957 RepID=UPI00245602D6|nr:hypothetical protein [Nocardia abscessus]